MTSLDARMAAARSIEGKCHVVLRECADVLAARAPLRALHQALPALAAALFGFADRKCARLRRSARALRHALTLRSPGSGGWLLAAERRAADADAVVALVRPDSDLFRVLLAHHHAGAPLRSAMPFAYPVRIVTSATAI